jgi:predicted DNA-binding protein (MmcQ/YjbR family)
MVFDDDFLKRVEEIGDYGKKDIDGALLFLRGEKVFLAVYPETNPLRLEVRADRNLSKTLIGRYESVLGGRVLGRNGMEIIASGQLADDEIFDLIRLSYNLSLNV